MKITSNLTHVATEIEFEAPLNEEEMLAVFQKSGVQGFPAELDIAERTEDHVQMMSLDGLLGFGQGVRAMVTYDVTTSRTPTTREVALPARGSWRATWRSAPRSMTCALPGDPREYFRTDARDAGLPVHTPSVEAYTGGTAFAWYGMSDYPRLKRFILRKLAQGGAQAKRNFILRASKAQVDLLEDY